MTNLKSGLSGCKIELLNDDVLRKYSSGEEYDERLRLQIKKQSLFSHFVLKNIDIPRVIHINEEPLSFDMEYVSGFSFDEYFPHTSVKDIDNIVESLCGYFDFLIKTSRVYHQDTSKVLMLKKLYSINVQRKDFMIYLVSKVSNLHIPHSFCHGDLTFANIIFHPNRLYFIDFLDSFIDSYLVDFAKLKQDLYYNWSLKVQGVNNLRIYQTYNYIWNKLRERYSSHLNTIEFKLLDVLNLLRIGPYLTDERHRIILNTLVEKTDLYEDLSRSYGWKV